jgi:thiol-disulfide isomerase/thioredoxin
MAVLAVVATLLGVATYSVSVKNDDTRIERGIHLSDIAQYDFEDLRGKPSTLQQWQGQVLILNFWASWCAPCREEMPLLAKFREQYRQKGVEIVGLAMDQKGPVQSLVNELNVHYPILLREGGLSELVAYLGNDYGALPFTVVFGRNGEMIGKIVGKVSESRLLTMVDNELKTVDLK